jgi:uncharacterized protein (TIRG00374 family)
MGQSNGRNWRFWAGMVLSVVCLGAIFFFVEPAEILAALRTARYEYLLVSALGIVAFLVLRTVRWRFMLDNDAPWWTVFHIQNIGYMMTTLLPLRLGDVARAVLIGNVPPITIARGVSTMVIERLLDLLFIVTLLPFTLSQVERLPAWMQAAAQVSGFLALAGIMVLIIAANQRPFVIRLARTILLRLRLGRFQHWLELLDNLLAGLSSLTRVRDGLILLALSVLVWLPILVAYYFTMRAVHLQPTAAMTGFVVCAAAFSVALPSSPGQVGVFHAGVLAALQVLGQPAAESASFAFLYHALNVVLVILLGLWGIFSTGATFQQVVASAQSFTRRQKETAA